MISKSGRVANPWKIVGRHLAHTIYVKR